MSENEKIKSDHYSPNVDNFSEWDNNGKALFSKRGHYINHDGHQQNISVLFSVFLAHGHTELRETAF